nr:MAG TPA: hypothetical protein [Caudoviricetes sp.]
MLCILYYITFISRFTAYNFHFYTFLLPIHIISPFGLSTYSQNMAFVAQFRATIQKIFKKECN